MMSLIREKLSAVKVRGNGHDEKDPLFYSIKEAYSDLEQAQLRFNQLSDTGAVDYASYSILAQQARCTYLMKLAREKNIRL